MNQHHLQQRDIQHTHQRHLHQQQLQHSVDIQCQVQQYEPLSQSKLLSHDDFDDFYLPTHLSSRWYMYDESVDEVNSSYTPRRSRYRQPRQRYGTSRSPPSDSMTRSKLRHRLPRNRRRRGRNLLQLPQKTRPPKQYDVAKVVKSADDDVVTVEEYSRNPIVIPSAVVSQYKNRPRLHNIAIPSSVVSGYKNRLSKEHNSNGGSIGGVDIVKNNIGKLSSHGRSRNKKSSNNKKDLNHDNNKRPKYHICINNWKLAITIYNNKGDTSIHVRSGSGSKKSDYALAPFYPLLPQQIVPTLARPVCVSVDYNGGG